MKLHIITGGSRGLGLALAQRLLEQGETVAVLSRTIPALEGPSFRHYPCDLSIISQIETALNAVFSDFSPLAFDEIILTNNAAVVTPLAPVGGLSTLELLQNLQVNLQAPLFASDFFLRKLVHFNGHCSIVNISSGAAINPKGSWALYSAAKAGLNAFSKALAQERNTDPKFRVLTIDPGVMDTGMQDRIRATNPKDFPGIDRFLKLKTENLLKSPHQIAKALCEKVLNPPFSKEPAEISLKEL